MSRPRPWSRLPVGRSGNVERMAFTVIGIFVSFASDGRRLHLFFLEGIYPVFVYIHDDTTELLRLRDGG